jgi:hypothetical protein
MFCLLVILLRHKYHTDSGFGKTSFTAYNDNINHGILMDFKSNNNLKITQMYKFGETTYYGKYLIKDDTIYFNIPTDFNLAKKAIIDRDTLKFLNENIVYTIINRN